MSRALRMISSLFLSSFLSKEEAISMSKTTPNEHRCIVKLVKNSGNKSFVAAVLKELFFDNAYI